jgi:serine/threonine protein kinase
MGGGASRNTNNQSQSAIDMNNYEFGDVIGTGGYASVRVAKFKPTGKIMVIKEMKLEESNAEKMVDIFTSELSALKLLRAHPHIPKLHASFHDDCHMYMGLDYAAGGDLRFHLNNNCGFTLEQVTYFVGCVGSALNFIHRHNMLHRDVKPENIVLTNGGRPLLTDYGVAYVETHRALALCKESSGTQQYLAPEVFTPSHRHSFQADFWSLGVVMFELLFKSRPFQTHGPKNIYDLFL